jgi:hypothetical protein
MRYLSPSMFAAAFAGLLWVAFLLVGGHTATDEAKENSANAW